MDRQKQRGKITILKINKEPRQIEYEGQKINVWEGQAMLGNKTYYFSKLLKPNKYLPFKENDILDAEYYIQERYDAKRDKTWENLRIAKVFGVEGKFSRETFQNSLAEQKNSESEEYLKEIVSILLLIERKLTEIISLLDNQN